jgi:ATP-binding cassette subfamily B protein
MKISHPPKSLFPFIWYFLREYKLIVIIFTLLSLATGLWGPFNSIIIKYIIDALPQVQGNNISYLLWLTSLIIVNFIVFDNFTWRGIDYIRFKFVPTIINHIVQQLMDYALGKSHQFFQDNFSGKIAKQITNLADCIEKLITNIIPNFLRGSSLLSSAFLIAYFVNPIFCVILIIWSVFFVSTSILMSRKLIVLSDALASAESVVIGQLVDSLSNNSNVRIFSRKFHEILRMVSFLDKQQKSYSAVYFYTTIIHAIEGVLVAIMIAGSSYSLVYLYSKNLVSTSDFVMILVLTINTAHMAWFTIDLVDEFNTIVGRCKRSLIFLMEPIEIQDKLDASILKCSYGKITFRNVQFKYKDTKLLFQNKSIEIKAGEKVGLVGYSGGGKSTFVNLILRLYDVTSGAILIDDQDIRNVTQDSLRTNIAMIPQDPSLFHRSLRENICYGKIDASNEEVIEASKKAHAHGFITQLPQGYNSLVGERGIKLSGGQRQRIAIARAILKNAPILILDEATSQLDSITESLIQETLWELMQGKTTIVIAHRLSTLLHMDRILVFDKGKIVEDGTHSKLLTNSALYQQLWNTQVGGFLVDKQ